MQDYLLHANLPKTILRGRWRHLRSARIYSNDVLSMEAQLRSTFFRVACLLLLTRSSMMAFKRWPPHIVVVGELSMRLTLRSTISAPLWHEKY